MSARPSAAARRAANAGGLPARLTTTRPFLASSAVVMADEVI